MKKYFYYQMDLKILNLLCCILMILLWIPNTIYFEYAFTVSYFILMFFYLFLHEIFHGLGFYFFAKAKHKNIVYGIELEKGIFYCMCKEEINKFGICASLLMPFLCLGVFTGILSYVFHFPILNFLSIFNVAGSIGDLMMFTMLVRMKDVHYKDLDDTSGFLLLSNDDLDQKKYLGLVLKEKGIYRETSAQNYEKVTITKASKIILLIFFLLILLFYGCQIFK